MLALVWDGAVNLREVPKPAPRPGEALVRVRLAGVCRTDLEVLRGYHGFRGVLGHEFIGVVEGPPASPRLGRRVVGEINLPCGACPRCRAGLGRHCLHRQVLGLKDRDGAFAEFLILPEENLHLVPDGLSDEAAVFTEPLAAALAVAEAGAISLRSRVLVVGDGALGLLTAMALAHAGTEVTLAGHYPERLRLAEPYGVAGFLEKDLPGQDFDVVVEAGGGPGGLDLALERVRPQGVVVLKSTYAGRYHLDPAALVVPEVHLRGSRCGPFPAALRLLSGGSFDPRPLISALLPFSLGVEALDRASRKGILKVVLDMRPEPGKTP
ncbi:MAG: alcohol dehydrogenase [Deltaproteobacteria bacterium]|nr:alcohol dehydrogenase [Deltaproteobacteria bacterium]